MAHSNEVKICPLCEHHNKPNVMICEVCDAPLHRTAVTTIYYDEDGTLRQEVVQETPLVDIEAVLSDLPDGSVALLVLGQSVPIIFKDVGEITLGRFVHGEPPPMVDLGEYHGHLLGVSRRHAVIRRVSGGYMIEDLNSNNGTWINNARIPANEAYPLMTGDQLRLGQLVIFVYFA